MSQAPFPPLWLSVDIAEHCFRLLNLDHPEISARILSDIDAGTAVYYDRRWSLTDRFCRFLLAEPAWVAGRTVLVLGAGVGLETLVIGRLCDQLYINDLSPVALELCAWQLSQNGMGEVTCLPGRYEHLVLPPVDLLVGCFLVYSRDSASAMRHLLERRTPPVLLMNDNTASLRTLVRRTSRQVRSLLPTGDIPCLLFTAAA
jgi:predicted nicotinamide N-methyase